MRLNYLFIYLILCCQWLVAQSQFALKKEIEFKQIENAESKTSIAIQLCEYYLEADQLETAQEWLNKAKELHDSRRLDATDCFIQSLQSELFYYNGLHQFGTQEAKKGIQKAIQRNDSVCIADSYFFLGINQLELNHFGEAEKALRFSRNYFPKKIPKKYPRTFIQNEHIYNNTAQLKLKVKELDSAIFYNAKAYSYAKISKNKRVIPNAEQTFGEIYLAKNQLDSALVYFTKSFKSAKNNNYFDIMLLNYGFMMKCTLNETLIENWFQKAQELNEKETINSAYQRYFYTISAEVFRQTGNKNNEILAQKQIIAIDTKTRNIGNLYAQNMTEQYVKSESKLLSLEINDLKRKQNMYFLQFLASLLCVAILGLLVILIRRKNKINKTLLNQKNEISKDLHDDIGSGLSSILIHANLLQNAPNSSEKQRLLATKINDTGKEISERLNTFIWSLNAEHNNLQHFLEYVKHYAENLFEETATQFIFTEEIKQANDIKIDGHQRKHLFFCIKEILNNTLKHAKASKIIVTFKIINKKKLLIQIDDDGIGLQKENVFGNGLKNIQKRVESLQGSFTIVTKNGVHSQIEIPVVFE